MGVLYTHALIQAHKVYYMGILSSNFRMCAINKIYVPLTDFNGNWPHDPCPFLPPSFAEKLRLLKIKTFQEGKSIVHKIQSWDMKKCTQSWDMTSFLKATTGATGTDLQYFPLCSSQSHRGYSLSFRCQIW